MLLVTNQAPPRRANVRGHGQNPKEVLTMSKLATVLAVFISLAVPAVAGAHQPRLTLTRAEAAIRANAALDSPTQTVVAGCHRDSAASITCTVREIGAHTLIEDDGEMIVGTLTYLATAHLAHGRVTVS
jgi:hypothetical protein